MKNKKRFETIWRNKWLTANATSIDDMINSLMNAVEELESLKQDGISADFDGADDDYIYFYTNDEEIADKYGMNEVEYEYDENESD